MFTEVLIPLGVCVVLPVLVVWLIARMRQNETNRKAEIMLKAIEKGAAIDTDLFKAQGESRTIKERLLRRLTAACVCSLLGVAFLVLGLCFYTNPNADFDSDFSNSMLVMGVILLAVGIALFIAYFTGRKMMAKEIEAEEKKLLGKE